MKLEKVPPVLIQWVHGKKIDKIKSPIISNELNLLMLKYHTQQVSLCLQQIYVLDLNADMAAKGNMA